MDQKENGVHAPSLRSFVHRKNRCSCFLELESQNPFTRNTSPINFGWTDRAIARELLGREPLTRWVSNGEYSKRMFVNAVRRGRTAGGGR